MDACNAPLCRAHDLREESEWKTHVPRARPHPLPTAHASSPGRTCSYHRTGSHPQSYPRPPPPSVSRQHCPCQNNMRGRARELGSQPALHWRGNVTTGVGVTALVQTRKAPNWQVLKLNSTGNCALRCGRQRCVVVRNVQLRLSCGSLTRRAQAPSGSPSESSTFGPVIFQDLIDPERRPCPGSTCRAQRTREGVVAGARRGRTCRGQLRHETDRGGSY